jgi:hypothetical protein
MGKGLNGFDLKRYVYFLFKQWPNSVSSDKNGPNFGNSDPGTSTDLCWCYAWKNGAMP